jgi:hypothetical protein
MTTAASQPDGIGAHMPDGTDVAIIGGGLAGLTCALRLCQRRYKVTLYEKTPILGGNLSSEWKGSMYHDVYPHLFCDWYANFWEVVERDLNIKREDAFERRMGVKVLHARDGAPKQPYQDLKNPTTLQNIWQNLWSGVLPPPDLFLLWFTLLDLASQPFRQSDVLERQTVNGFLYSRRYVTEDVADLHNTILMEIWSIYSSDTSAGDYKQFVRPGLLLSYGAPFAWLLRGSLQEKLIAPWCDKLRDCRDCTIKHSTEVTNIELGDRKVKLTLKDKPPKEHANVVLAVPAPELARLVMTGGPGKRIVDKVPELSELQRLRTARILVVNIYFDKKLNIPRENVGLAGSHGYMTFLDISQLWKSLSGIKEQHTVLVLAASDAYAFPAEPGTRWAYRMIEELTRYLPDEVKPGNAWGDPPSATCNIDYSKSWYQEQYSRRLFLNEVESDIWQPDPCYPSLPGVFFAGDFCVNDVKMATVEAAVISGLNAAGAIQMMVEKKCDITVAPRTAPHHIELLALKLILLPAAYGANAWSTVNAALGNLAKGQIAAGTVAPLAGLSLLPLGFLYDWLATIEALGIDSVSPGDERFDAASSFQHALTLAASGLLAAGNYLRDAASKVSLENKDELPDQKKDKSRDLCSLLGGLLEAVDEALKEAPPSPPAAVGRRMAAAREEISGPPIPADLRWVAAATSLVRTLGSAIGQGGELVPGSGRYQSRSEYVRRHRAKP